MTRFANRLVLTMVLAFLATWAMLTLAIPAFAADAAAIPSNSTGLQQLWQVALQNWASVVALIVFALGLLKGIPWLTLLLRTADYAFRQAETLGALNGIKGFAKAEPYLDAFFDAWEARTGSIPGAITQGLATTLAARKAAQEKVVAPVLKQLAPTQPPSSQSTGPSGS